MTTQQVSLYAAAGICALVGLAHSVLGERYILKRLFKRENLPRLWGDSLFFSRTLRYAWHLTSVAWLGFAGIALLLAHPPLTAASIGEVIAAVFFIHFAVSLVASRGLHLAWVAFLAIALLAFFATR